MSAELRFALMLDELEVGAWVSRCLDHLLAVPDVELVLLIVNARPARKSFLQKIRSGLKRENWRFLLANVYFGILLSRLMPQRPHSSYKDLFGRTPTIFCNIERRGKYSEYFSAADVHRISNYKLDFILRFGFGIIRGDILQSARYGVWSFHHDDDQKYRGGPPAFWEIYFGDPVTGAILQRLTDKLDAGIVLYKGFFKTLHNSYPRNLQQVLFQSTPWPARVCKDIQNGTARYLDAAPSDSRAPIYHAPTNAQLARFFLRAAWSLCRRAVTWPFRLTQWNVGIVNRPIHSFLESQVVRDIHWLPDPPRQLYVADPFGLQSRADLLLLAEVFDHRTARGSIAALRLVGGHVVEGPTTVIDLSTHLSYPYLATDGTDIYCIPESAQAGGVYLFRAQQFPWHWEHVSTLLESVQLVDPTIFRYAGRWWMLGVSGDAGPWCTLYGWYADRLQGPWVPHGANPLKADIRSSQPAGTPFIHDGVLYRPAQNGARRYGGEITLQRVLKLTPTEFEEEPVSSLTADPSSRYGLGIHTLSAVGDITLVDGQREIFGFVSPRPNWSDVLRRR
jgi:hypothetical protein